MKGIASQLDEANQKLGVIMTNSYYNGVTGVGK